MPSSVPCGLPIDPPQGGGSSPPVVAYKWVVLTNTTLGLLMASINSTIILIALPAIFRGLGVYPFAPDAFVVLLWSLLIFGVITATLVVSVGRLSDVYGRARMYNAGFAIFTIGSILLFALPSSGITGGWELVGFRLVQGIGASFIFANAAALIADAFPPAERARALGINQVAAVGGAVLGLVLGGVLSAAPDLHVGSLLIESWRYVFLVSVPVGVFGTYWAYRRLRETATLGARARIDIAGNVTFGAGLTLLLAGLTYSLIPYGSSNNGWSSPWVLGAIVTALVLLGAFLVIERRTPDPMFQLSLFRNRAFAAGNLSALLGWMALGGLQFMLILWFQGIWLPLHGYSFSVTPFWAGIYMLPMMAGSILLAPISGMLSERIGARVLSTTGLCIAAVGFLGLLTLSYDFPYWQMATLLFVLGCGLGMFGPPNAAAIMNSVPPTARGAASGMLTTLQNAGQILSLAIFFSVLIGVFSGHLGSAFSSALSGTGLPSGDAPILTGTVVQDPTGAIFGAFLGINPMSIFLTALNGSGAPGWTAVPAGSAAWNTLTTTRFFPGAVAPAFQDGVHSAFLVAFGITATGAVVSALRGEPYLHHDAYVTTGGAAAGGAPTSPASAETK